MKRKKLLEKERRGYYIERERGAIVRVKQIFQKNLKGKMGRFSLMPSFNTVVIDMKKAIQSFKYCDSKLGLIDTPTLERVFEFRKQQSVYSRVFM